MSEVAEVARAYGYASINQEKVDFQVSRATIRPLPGVQPSMLADAFGQRSMEVDAIIGNVIRLAQAKDIKTPTLRVIATLLRGLDSSFATTKST